MYRVWLGKISVLKEAACRLPVEIQQQAPTGPRRDTWLAGRVLLATATGPLPLSEIIYGKNGKPAFRDAALPSFNLSHSGDHIALLVSDEGEVGCDIEVIRPRKNWPQLAQALFSDDERQALDTLPADDRLAAFWQIWTRKEAVLKQASGSVWQLASQQATEGVYLTQLRVNPQLWLTLCTPTPCPLSTSDIHFLSDRPRQTPQV